MRRLGLVAALLAAPAWASVIGTGAISSGAGGGGGPPDPARDDVAASYTATGPNGVRTVPQVNPAALGVCSALAGAWAATTPDYETQVTGYFCNGTRWARVWTDEDGVTVSPDRTVAGRTFVSQALSGDYAFKANNRPIWDLGDGVADELVSLGSRIRSGSWEVASGQSLTTDVLAPTTAGTDLIVSLQARLFILQPGLAPACTVGRAGGLQSRSADGNRLWHCDGTAAYRVSRVVVVPVTFDAPSVPNGSCITPSVTVAGVTLNDTISVNADFALPDTVSIGNVRATGADTVALRLCNVSPTTSEDPASGVYRFRIER